MAVRTIDLHAIPLFQGITEQHLHALLGAFEQLSLPAGTVLFEAGSKPDYFHLLVSGEVELREGDAARFTLTPLAPIGELGVLTGLHRNTTAVTTKPSEVYRISRAALLELFERHGDIAFPFEHNLLQVVALKIRRDNRRIDEMRGNLIRTQKAMKRLLDMVLEAPETPQSKDLVETLEDLIEHNKRGHYLVEPTGPLHSSIRLDDGVLVPVLEMSDGMVRFGKWPGANIKNGGHFSGVLVTSQGEVPVSGTVESVSDTSVLLKLDLLIDEYQKFVREYLTRVQMLDFVV
ncbi:MAG: cyclic nucleotide-binding domain-containing protein [Polyangiaceae bacterium]|nr:cyclic nucleotide-binding domain-containing protein [Polyangiaceae bacterium]